MTTYYKVTRPDGTDFHTGTIDWLDAFVTHTPPPPLPGVGPVPGQDWYHASYVMTECYSTYWPCRLFAVEADGDVQRSPTQFTTVGARTFDVQLELDAVQVLGPQGNLLLAFFDAIDNLNAGEVAAMIRESDALRADVSSRMWGTFRDGAWRAARDQSAVHYRTTSLKAAWHYALQRGSAKVPYAAWDIGNAAVALSAKDLLSTAQYDSLNRVWSRSIGALAPTDPPPEENAVENPQNNELPQPAAPSYVPNYW